MSEADTKTNATPPAVRKDADLVVVEQGNVTPFRAGQGTFNGTADEALDKKRSWLLPASFILIVVLPVLAVAWFLMTEASPRFTAEFRVAVRSLDAPAPVGVEGFLGVAGMGTPVSNESHAVVQFLESRAIIDGIEGTLAGGFDGIFAKPGIDPLSGISPNAPVESRLKHWIRFVDVRFETSSGTVIVETTTFSPEDTLALGAFLLNESEQFVNELSQLARSGAVSFAQQEYEIAEKRMMQARASLNAFQETERTLDPMGQAESSQSLLAELEQALLEQKLRLSAQQRELSDDSFLVQRTLLRIDDLEAAIADIKNLATSSEGAEERPLTQLVQEFSRLSSEAEFAELSYLSALSSLETARMEADRHKLYLATIVKPGLPEQASFPKPVSGIFIAFCLALAAWSIGVIGIVTVREHM